jgi:enterochelin esterase-like enzyme
MSSLFCRARLRRNTVLILLLSLLGATALASEVSVREFASPTLARSWTYHVYLPSGYDTAKLRYPVLYLLHGSGQKGADWLTSGHVKETADSLIASGEIPPAIIVMPDAGNSWYVDREEKMETAVIQDLLGDVDGNFRTVAARQGRLVAGLSMGGYGALRFAFKYPELFAAAALLSPAIYDPEPPMNSSARKAPAFGSPDFDDEVWKRLNYPALWEGFLAKKITVPIYIASGDDDQYFIEDDAAKLYSLLRRSGQPAELRIVDGTHAWSVWAETVGGAMKYVFRFSAPPATRE